MGRKGIEVITLYGYTIEEIQKIKNSSESKFERDMLDAVIMRYKGISTIKIAGFLLRSKQTVINYIKRWNSEGLKVLGCNHGGRKRTFTDEMIADLMNTILYLRPNDFGFNEDMWSCQLLVKYIYKNYGKKYTNEYIRILLKRNSISLKIT